jgi:hypothetical protein
MFNGMMNVMKPKIKGYKFYGRYASGFLKSADPLLAMLVPAPPLPPETRSAIDNVLGDAKKSGNVIEIDTETGTVTIGKK